MKIMGSAHNLPCSGNSQNSGIAINCKVSKSTAPQAGRMGEDTVPEVIGIELGITTQREVAQNEARLQDIENVGLKKKSIHGAKGAHEHIPIQAYLFVLFYLLMFPALLPESTSS